MTTLPDRKKTCRNLNFELSKDIGYNGYWLIFSGFSQLAQLLTLTSSIASFFEPNSLREGE